MASSRELKVVILGDSSQAQKAFSQLSGAADDSQGKLQAFSSKLNAAGDKMVAVGAKMTKAVTLPILAVAGVSTKLAMDVQTGLREVVTLFGETGAAGDKTFGQLQKGLQGLSKELGVSQKVLTGGLYQAISAGVPKENVFEFMKVASKAAIAGVTDTETAVDGITTIINAFGMSAKDARKVADSMFTTVKGGKTDFRQLSDALFNIAPAAAAAKVSMKEVNAAIATLTASGTPTAVATTQIRAALVGLQRPSAEMNEIFKKLGFQNAQMAIESKGLGFALDAVKKSTGGNNGELQKLLGSTEAVAAANVLAGTGAKKFATELAAQEKAAGATDKAFSEMDKGRNIERLKVSLENLSIQIGNALLPIVKRITDAVTPWLEKFSQLSPKTQNLILMVAGLAAALGPLLIVFGHLVKAMSLIVGHPIIAAIALIAAGLIYAYTHSETFRNIVDGAFRVVAAAAGFMKDVVVGSVQFMVDKFLAAAEWIVKAAAKAFGWIPGIGEDLRKAARDIEKFRDEANAKLAGIKDREINVRVKAAWDAGGFAPPWQQRRAHGGPVRSGTPYLVGERGPEVIVPGNSGTVIPNHRLSTASGGTVVNNHYNVNVPNYVGDKAELMRVVVEELRRLVGRGVTLGIT